MHADTEYFFLDLCPISLYLILSAVSFIFGPSLIIV